RSHFLLAQALLALGTAALLAPSARAAGPAHPNPTGEFDEAFVRNRPDVRRLPGPLKDRLGAIPGRPAHGLPPPAFPQAGKPSRLFQYSLLDSDHFEPNVFTHVFPGVNDQVQLTATGPNGGLPTIGAVRLVLEPKPGLPTDPNDPEAFIDVFTDISGLF